MKSKILIGLIAILALAQLWFFSRFTVDDAYISFRYARNLAQGNGLVFNPGERVEGYTNFSYTILTVPAFWFHVDPLPWARGVSCAALAGIFVLLYRWSRGFVSGKTERVLPLLILALSPMMFYWTMAGLETAVFAFMFLWVLLLEMEDNRGLIYPVAHLLLILTRPEGFLISGLLWVHRWWRARRIDWRLAAPYAAGVLAYLTFKLAYYGALLPNTFHAKSAGAVWRGQTLQFIQDYPLAVVALLAAVGLWRSPIRILAFLLVVFLAVPVLTGGDAMPLYRFFVHLLPPIAILVTAWAFARPGVARRAAILALTGLCLSYSLIFYVAEQLPALVFTDRVARIGEKAGNWIREHTGSEDWIAVNAAGALPFFSERPCIDMLGLNDAHIARAAAGLFQPNAAIGPGHARGDGNYVLGRRPAVILWGNSGGSPAPVYIGDQQMAASPALAEGYRMRRVILREDYGREVYPLISKRRRYEPIRSFTPLIGPERFAGRDPGLGVDGVIDGTAFPYRFEVYRFSSPLTLWVRADHPLATLTDEEPMPPPAPLPEKAMSAGQLLDAAIFHAEEGRLADAERTARRSLERSDNFYVRFVLGRILVLAGDKPGARRELEEALRLKPGMQEAEALLRELEPK